MSLLIALVGGAAAAGEPWIDMSASQPPTPAPIAKEYPCTVSELGWIKMKTESGSMSTEEAALDMGCLTDFVDPDNDCSKFKLKQLKDFVVAGGNQTHGEFTLGCKSTWSYGTKAPTAAPTKDPWTDPPTPAPPTPAPTKAPTYMPGKDFQNKWRADWKAGVQVENADEKATFQRDGTVPGRGNSKHWPCIPDDRPLTWRFENDHESTFVNSPAMCCTENATYFKWDTFVGGHTYCGLDKGESPSCVPDEHMIVHDVPCCTSEQHYRADALNPHRTGWWCGVKSLELLTPSDAIDCRVTAWDCEPQCSISCSDGPGGAGSYHCSRTVTVKKDGHGMECPALEKDVTCNTHRCPIDCVQVETDSCSACDKSCGGGGKKLCRKDLRVHNAFGGKQCTEPFMPRPCTGPVCPIDCAVSQWQAWGVCTRSCGSGRRLRYRTITQPPLFGGAACPIVHNAKECNAFACPIDCVMGHFQSWSQCSVSCGGGTTKSGRVISRAASHGGKICPTDNLKSEVCNAFKCAFPICHKDMVSCTFSSFLNHIVVKHRKMAMFAGSFHCHRLGNTACHSSPPSMRSVHHSEAVGTLSRGVAGSEDTCSGTAPRTPPSAGDVCQCVCSKHSCCAKKGVTLDNDVLLGNQYDHVPDLGECCSKCTNNPLCSSWEFRLNRYETANVRYELGGTCVLKTGAPSYKAGRVFENGRCKYSDLSLCNDTWAGPRSEGEVCSEPWVETSFWNQGVDIQQQVHVDAALQQITASVGAP